MRRARLRGLPCAVLTAALAVVSAGGPGRAQDAPAEPPSTKEDLGDTGAPPPTAEDLGKEAPAPAAPEPKKRRRAPATDAGPAAAEAPAAAPAAPPDAAPARAPAAAKIPPKPAAPVPAAPPPGPSAEAVARAAKLYDELFAALAAEPGDQRALDALAQTQGIEAHIAIDPSLRALVRLARARSLLLQGRLDESATALGEARAAADATAGPRGKSAAAQVRYRLGELEEARTRARKTCGLELGLTRLAAWEGKLDQESTKRIAARYKSAAQAGDRFWARRAAYRTAVLYEQRYRESLKPAKSLRAVRLPSPFAVGKVSTDEVLADIVKGAWPGEIARLYSSIIGSVDARDPDAGLVEAARKSAAELGRLTAAPGESAENPYFKDEGPDLIRYLRRFEKRDSGGRWHPMDPVVARKTLAAVLDKGPGSIAFSYALVGLAEAGPAPSSALVLAALASPDARTRLAGLIAAERAPSEAFAAPIVDLLIASSAEARKGAFTTLQGALYGEVERSLLALRAIASKNREVAEKLLADTRLPTAERLWIVAEVGDTRLAGGMQALAYNEDPVVASRAIFGLYLAQGRNGLGYARPQADGLVGCVSKAVQAMDAGPR